MSEEEIKKETPPTTKSDESIEEKEIKVEETKTENTESIQKEEIRKEKKKEPIKVEQKPENMGPLAKQFENKDLPNDDNDEDETLSGEKSKNNGEKTEKETSSLGLEISDEKIDTISPKVKKEWETEEVPDEPKEEIKLEKIFALRTTANREDQVADFVSSNVKKKKLEVYSVIRAHGMRGYIFLEAASKSDAEQSAFNVPYARGILPKEIEYSEIEHMLEEVKKDVNIQKKDIVEIISGPFKREKAKVVRIDKQKGEVVVELLEAAVPIPMTVKLDSVKVIRREDEETEDGEEDSFKEDEEITLL